MRLEFFRREPTTVSKPRMSNEDCWRKPVGSNNQENDNENDLVEAEDEANATNDANDENKTSKKKSFKI